MSCSWHWSRTAFLLTPKTSWGATWSRTRCRVYLSRTSEPMTANTLSTETESRLWNTMARWSMKIGLTRKRSKTSTPRISGRLWSSCSAARPFRSLKPWWASQFSASYSSIRSFPLDDDRSASAMPLFRIPTWIRPFSFSLPFLDWPPGRVSVPTFWPDPDTRYQPLDPARNRPGSTISWPGPIDPPSNRKWRQNAKIFYF